MVDVDQNQRARSAKAIGLRHDALQLLVEMAAIGETRERVGARTSADLLDLPNNLQRPARQRRQEADIPRLVLADFVPFALPLDNQRADRSDRSR